MSRIPRHLQNLKNYGATVDQLAAFRRECERHGIVGPSYNRHDCVWVMNRTHPFLPGVVRSHTIRKGTALMAATIEAGIDQLVAEFETLNERAIEREANRLSLTTTVKGGE